MLYITLQDSQCTYNVSLRRVSPTIFAVENNKHYIFRVCGCVLVIVVRRAKRMRRIMLSPATSRSLPHFFTLSHKRTNFGRYLLNMF
jgi:hypothetical protein